MGGENSGVVSDAVCQSKVLFRCPLPKLSWNHVRTAAMFKITTRYDYISILRNSWSRQTKQQPKQHAKCPKNLVIACAPMWVQREFDSRLRLRILHIVQYPWRYSYDIITLLKRRQNRDFLFENLWDDESEEMNWMQVLDPNNVMTSHGKKFRTFPWSADAKLLIVIFIGYNVTTQK